jgi:hypothetical protein
MTEGAAELEEDGDEQERCCDEQKAKERTA